MFLNSKCGKIATNNLFFFSGQEVHWNYRRIVRKRIYVNCELWNEHEFLFHSFDISPESGILPQFDASEFTVIWFDYRAYLVSDDWALAPTAPLNLLTIASQLIVIYVSETIRKYLFLHNSEAKEKNSSVSDLCYC